MNAFQKVGKPIWTMGAFDCWACGAGLGTGG